MTGIVRPNGRIYRPKKPPSLEEYTTYDQEDSIVVVRTHDITVATLLAADKIAEYDLQGCEVMQEWWRLVPWDHNGMFPRSWITDEVRGTPCVVWYPS